MFGIGKKKGIRFSAEELHLDVFQHPANANRFLPDYYKKLAPRKKGALREGTAKACIPFLDACSSGYIIPLWADMYVKASGGDITISFSEVLPMRESLGQHKIEQLKGYPREKEPYGSNLLKFMNPWVIETAPGYSCIFTSPFNHFESRFKLVDAVVDTDTYYNNINFPFVWTGGDGEFVVKAGTPLVQVIPFKREEHKLEIGVVDSKKLATVSGKLSTKAYDAYKTLFWHKRKNSTE